MSDKANLTHYEHAGATAPLAAQDSITNNHLESKQTYSTGGTATGTDGVAPGAAYGAGGPIRRAPTLDDSQPAFPIYHRKFANPAPLGLISFATTGFLLFLIQVQARSLTQANVVLGMALFYGGLVQLVAGIQDWACGNTFGATVFSSYAGLWFSFGVLYVPQFQVLSAYATPQEASSAVGLYLAAWGIVTFIFLIASLRSSIALVATFVCLDITFWLLCAANMQQSVALAKAGGSVGIVTTAIAAYIALAGLLTKDTSFFLLPLGDLSRVGQKQ